MVIAIVILSVLLALSLFFTGLCFISYNKRPYKPVLYQYPELNMEYAMGEPVYVLSSGNKIAEVPIFTTITITDTEGGKTFYFDKNKQEILKCLALYNKRHPYDYSMEEILRSISIGDEFYNSKEELKSKMIDKIYDL